MPHALGHLLPVILGLAACGKPADSADPASPIQQVRTSLHETIGSLVYVDWEQTEAAEVQLEFSVDGETWLASPSTPREPGPGRELLLGIPFDSTAQVRFVVDGEPMGAPVEVSTGPQPAGVPTLEVLAAEPEAWDPDTRYVLASIDEISDLGVSVRTWSFVFDRNGQVVWAWETPLMRATLHARVARTGSEFLLDYGSFYAIFDGGDASQVARLKIDGTELARYDTPGLHHPFTDTPDGGLIWGAHNGGSNTLRQLDPDGTLSDIWRCDTFYEDIKYDNEHGGCSSNTVTWDDASGHVLFSLYTSDSVVEIDPTTGESLRWFGHLPEAWGFDPADSAFWWQHGVHYTAEGTLLVSAREARFGNETVVREYAMDEQTETLVQVWTFGDGQGVYGSEMGEAHRLGNGNTLHNYGSGARVREITPEGEVVWDLGFSSGTYLGRTTPIADLYAFAP